VIIVPCHRIIAAGGGLGGYSSGLARKRALLAHESRFLGRGGAADLARSRGKMPLPPKLAAAPAKGRLPSPRLRQKAAFRA